MGTFWGNLEEMEIEASKLGMLINRKGDWHMIKARDMGELKYHPTEEECDQQNGRNLGIAMP